MHGWKAKVSVMTYCHFAKADQPRDQPRQQS
jgi:hypothetical protein